MPPYTACGAAGGGEAAEEDRGADTDEEEDGGKGREKTSDGTGSGEDALVSEHRQVARVPIRRSLQLAGGVYDIEAAYFCGA